MKEFVSPTHTVEPFMTDREGPTFCPLRIAHRYHENAMNCSPQLILIDHVLMYDLARISASIYSNVDRDDPFQCKAARQVWLVKNTLFLTALEYSDSRLGIAELISTVTEAADSIPSIKSAVEDFNGVVKYLVSDGKNPKREKIIELSSHRISSNLPNGILSNLCGSSTLGWPSSFTPASDLGLQNFEVIRTGRQLKSRIFDAVLIPGSLRLAPPRIYTDLLYGGRASRIELIAYKAEKASIPTLRPLPFKSIYYFQNEDDVAVEAQTPSVTPQEVMLDSWIDNSFWTSLRYQFENTESAKGDLTASARFVLFADETGTFLPSDGNVVEISKLFEHESYDDSHDEKLPRTPVKDLEEGDIVMLRLSGSGDYLESVATSLMHQAGEISLRENALQWKHRLYEALKFHGEGVVGVQLRAHGVKLRSSSYLWEWASDEVMSPNTFEAFCGVISTIWKLENNENTAEGVAFAQARWQEMERLKSYHQKAGAKIREALIERVQTLIAIRDRVETSVLIDLPGVQSGTMGLLRIEAVDTQVMPIPKSKLFCIERIGKG